MYTSLANNYVVIVKGPSPITDRMFMECATEITIKVKTTLRFLQGHAPAGWPHRLLPYPVLLIWDHMHASVVVKIWH